MKSVGESLMCEYLDVYLGKYKHIDNYRPDWLTNPRTGQPLEIDRYYPDLKAGFEYQGEYHLRPIEGTDEFRYRRYLDNLKRRLASQQGVKIISVEPIDLTINVMSRYARRASREYLDAHKPSRRERKRHRDMRQRELRETQKTLRPVSLKASTYRKTIEDVYGPQIGTHLRKKPLRQKREKQFGLNEFNPFCPKCGSEMVKRHRHSDGAGFWGCPGWPNYNGIVRTP